MGNFGEYLESFATYLRLDRGLSPLSIEAYLTDIRLFLEALTVEFAQVGAEHLESFAAELRGRGISARSIARKASALRLFFRYAQANHWIACNPAERLNRPRLTRGLPKVLTSEQVQALLDAPFGAGAAVDALMLRVLYASGLRVSELVALPISGVDVENGMIRVTGKGDKIRVVPIDVETAAMISAYLRAIRPQLCKRKGETALFLSKRGLPFTRQGFWKLVKKYALLAGLPRDVSPHVVRHAFATHLLERGMNLRLLQMLLGHSDISTTEIYSHVSTGHLREALRKYHPRGGGDAGGQ